MPQASTRRPFVLIIVFIVVVAAGTAAYISRLNAHEPASAPQSEASKEALLERRSLQTIAEQLGAAEIYAALRAEQQGTQQGAEHYIIPTSTIRILKPDGKGGVTAQDLPAIPDSGYRVIEVRAGTHTVWRVQTYDGYMRADPRMETARK